MIAQIETTNFCNHRCWYCQNAHYKPPPHKIMDLDLFDCILKEISRTFSRDNLNIISFAAYNEPTLDPYFKERLCMLTELGFQYWFISNGSHMTPALVEFIIREQIAVYTFLFNVPALDPAEFHAAVHVPAGHINTIRENLIFFLKHRKKINVDITIVVNGDQSQRHHRNYQHVKDFFKGYGVNIAFGPVMNRAGMLDEVVGQSVDHQTAQLACAVNYLNNIYVGVEANIYLCCHDYYQKFSYGNLMDASLKALLNSRNRHITLENFRKKFCRYCPFARPLQPDNIDVSAGNAPPS